MYKRSINIKRVTMLSLIPLVIIIALTIILHSSTSYYEEAPKDYKIPLEETMRL